VFIYASYDKILHPQAFAEAVYNYQILPDLLINATALVLPWLELILGLCLASGFMLQGAAALSTLLLVVFMAALTFNQIRGLDVSCGCFTTSPEGGPANMLTVARDFSFLIVSLYICARLFWPRSKGQDLKGVLNPSQDH
jgi:uncharacterized membrane protein YphA (DoxX/SURF4 family)